MSFREDLKEALKETLKETAEWATNKVNKLKPQTQLFLRACRTGNAPLAKKMMDKGADVNSLVFLGKGYNPDMVFKFYGSPLWLVAYQDGVAAECGKENKGYQEIAKMILSHPKFNADHVGHVVKYDDDSILPVDIQKYNLYDLVAMCFRSQAESYLYESSFHSATNSATKSMFNIMNKQAQFCEINEENKTYKIYYPNHRLKEEGALRDYQYAKSHAFRSYYEDGTLQEKFDNGLTESYRSDGTLRCRWIKRGEDRVYEAYDEKGKFVKREVSHSTQRNRVSAEIQAVSKMKNLSPEKRKSMKEDMVRNYRQRNPRMDDGR